MKAYIQIMHIMFNEKRKNAKKKKKPRKIMITKEGDRKTVTPLALIHCDFETVTC